MGLLTNHPLLRGSNVDAMSSIEPGWATVIDEALAKLNALGEELAAQGIVITVHQIKEKFGELRFYYQLVTTGAEPGKASPDADVIQRVSKVISEAKRRTSEICQRCGTPTPEMSNLGGYICRMCPACIKKLQERNAAEGGD